MSGDRPGGERGVGPGRSRSVKREVLAKSGMGACCRCGRTERKSWHMKKETPLWLIHSPLLTPVHFTPYSPLPISTLPFSHSGLCPLGVKSL